MGKTVLLGFAIATFLAIAAMVLFKKNSSKTTPFTKPNPIQESNVELPQRNPKSSPTKVWLTGLASALESGRVGFAFRSGEMNSYIVFSKKHPLGEYASGMFDLGYMILMGNGTMDRITSKWVPTFNETNN